LFPEFLTDRCEAEAIAGNVLHWLNEEDAYQALCQELKELSARVGEPGACERVARFVLLEMDKRRSLKLSSDLRASA